MSQYGSFNPSAVVKLVLGTVFFTLFGCEESSAPQKATPKKTTVAKVEKQKKRDVILCFGNSLTEGYGLNSEESYPNLLQNKLDSFGYDYEVVNAGLSGETTAGGRGRLNWVLKNNVNIFILELGANDGLRGIPLKTTNDNLKDIIDTVKAKSPNVEIVLAGMQIPPNLGIEYTNGFESIFPNLAKTHKIHLIPFLLEGVAGNPSLNQADGIHPTTEGTKRVVENVWKVIESLLVK